MNDEPMRSDRPRQNIEEMGSDLARAWMMMAEQAPHIAAARRTIFLAYVAEGFSEAQALELVKSI